MPKWIMTVQIKETVEALTRKEAMDEIKRVLAPHQVDSIESAFRAEALELGDVLRKKFGTECTFGAWARPEWARCYQCKDSPMLEFHAGKYKGMRFSYGVCPKCGHIMYYPDGALEPHV